MIGCLQVVISEEQNVTWVTLVMKWYDFGQNKERRLHLTLQEIQWGRNRKEFPGKYEL